MTGTWNGRDQTSLVSVLDILQEFNVGLLDDLLQTMMRVFLYIDKSEDGDMRREVVENKIYDLLLEFANRRFGD